LSQRELEALHPEFSCTKPTPRFVFAIGNQIRQKLLALGKIFLGVFKVVHLEEAFSRPIHQHDSFGFNGLCEHIDLFGFDSNQILEFCNGFIFPICRMSERMVVSNSRSTEYISISTTSHRSRNQPYSGTMVQRKSNVDD